MTSEKRVVNADTGGEKGGKIERYDLIPVQPLEEVARHYGVGASKYEDRNWERGYQWSLSYAALQRHAQAFWGGESYDPESGTHHLAAVVFHAFAMMEYERTHPELDNRPTTINAAPPAEEFFDEWVNMDVDPWCDKYTPDGKVNMDIAPEFGTQVDIQIDPIDNHVKSGIAVEVQDDPDTWAVRLYGLGQHEYGPVLYFEKWRYA